MAFSKILSLPTSFKVTAGFCLTLGEHFETAQPSLDPSAPQDSLGLMKSAHQYSLAYVPLSTHVLQAVTFTFDCKIQVSGGISFCFFDSLDHALGAGRYDSRAVVDCHLRLAVLWEVSILIF